MSTYLIEYSVYNSKYNLVKYGKMKVKNKNSEFEAKCKFEEHLKKKIPDFKRLVIHSCKVDYMTDIFGDIFGSNPFKN